MRYLNSINNKIYKSFLFEKSKVVIKNNGTVEVVMGKNKLIRYNFINIKSFDEALIENKVAGYGLEREEG